MKARWMMAGGAGLVVVAGAAAFALPHCVPPDEVAELVAHGDEQVLRSDPAAPGDAPHVIVFALDGVGKAAFERALRDHHAPHIERLLGEENGRGVYEHGYAVPNALSILPSTTMAAWSSVFTGKPAAETGVPGNEWFIREEMRFIAPAPVSVRNHEHTFEMLNDGLLGEAIRVPTLFERARVRSHVSLAPVYRGASLFTVPDPSTLAEMFGALAEGIFGEESVGQEAYRRIDENSVDTVLEAIEEHGVPSLQVVYFPGIDLYTHVAPDPLEKQSTYLADILDPAIGKVLEAYRARGVLERTYVLFIADHGHTPVLNDDRHSLGSEGDSEPPALIARAGFRMRPYDLGVAGGDQDYQAAVAYQGAIAYVYLADRSTCPRRGDRCDWRRPPRLQEDVMPVVQAFDRVNRTGQPIQELEGSLDLIFAREGRPAGEESLPFSVFDGTRLVSIEAYLAQHRRPDLLDLERRMRGLAVGRYGNRAGDVLLLARSGMERPIEERFYFSGPYRSWHGSPARQDSEVPFVLARLQDSGARLRGLVRQFVGSSPSQLDVTPLVVALLQNGARRTTQAPRRAKHQ